MDWNTVVQIADKGGTLVLLLVILWTGSKGRWHFDREFQALRTDRDEWKSLALQGSSLAREAVSIAGQK